jgi:hypothetical protein
MTRAVIPRTHPKIPDLPLAAPPPSRHALCAAPAPVVLSASRAAGARPSPRAWCLRGPSSRRGLLASKLSASATIKEAELPPSRATVAAARLGRRRRRASPLVHSRSQVTPLAPSSCTTRAPRALCAPAAPLPSPEQSLQQPPPPAAVACHHRRPLYPNRALKTVASEPIGLPHLFRSQVRRSPRRNLDMLCVMSCLAPVPKIAKCSK